MPQTLNSFAAGKTFPLINGGPGQHVTVSVIWMRISHNTTRVDCGLYDAKRQNRAREKTRKVFYDCSIYLDQALFVEFSRTHYHYLYDIFVFFLWVVNKK